MTVDDHCLPNYVINFLKLLNALYNVIPTIWTKYFKANFHLQSLTLIICYTFVQMFGNLA